MNLEMPFVTIATIVLACHQIFVAVWLALNKARSSAAAALVAFLLVNAGCEAISVVQSLGGLLHHTWLLAVYQTALYAMPPLMYLYVATSAPPLPASDPRRPWLLALGPLLALLCMTPFLAMAPAQRISALEAGYLGIGAEHLVMGIPLQICVLAFPIYAAAYWYACFRRLRRHLRVVEGFFSNIEDKTLAWLRRVLIVLCAALAWNAASTLSEPLLGYSLTSEIVEVLIEAAWVYPLTLLALMQPPVFASAEERSDALQAEEAQAEPRKYARSALSAQDLQRIAAKIERALADDRLYRNAALTLRGLSDHTGVPQNYLSQTLNTHIGSSFFDYVNRWRVEEACRQLRDPARSILTISEDVGFQSRSTFNAAFKKVTGQTPSAYRQGAAAGAMPERPPP